jgi:4-amino-4-deoxy-L-arabinose transferase-like glycosyltransferase
MAILTSTSALPTRYFKCSKTWISLSLVIGFSFLIHVFCMQETSLLVEEAYYWNYAQHLDFSYLDHPPMVALLIKLFTLVFGTHEFSVRLPSLFCWLITVFFSYKLSELMHKGSGRFALMLLAILPYFFAQSIVITPDAPLIACWSASLYCLYRGLVLNEPPYWYASGIWLGCGMLSKYTICLLGLATLCYLVLIPKARQWFLQKEPYLCALTVILLFTPVIYWNATHEWASFIFQSHRRFASTTPIDLPHVLVLTLLFITPMGVWGLKDLLKKNRDSITATSDATKKFIQIFTLVPLSFFALYSLNHEINFNWIGPLFLALIPWLAALMTHHKKTRTIWFATAGLLLFAYTTTIMIVSFNKSELIQQKLFIKLIAWDGLIKQLNNAAQQVEATTHSAPIFVPLDNYPISSELAFYQAQHVEQNRSTTIYPTMGAHIFGRESLMYRYWSKKENLSGKPLIIISKELWRFDDPQVCTKVIELSPLTKVWSQGQGQGVKNIAYYYKVVRMKT